MENDGDIGLVLSGGGAKGAFQAGVWKAMCELGLARRVRAISGTSVGALNAAAFATVRDPEAICRFWRTRVGEVATPYLRQISFVFAFIPDAKIVIFFKMSIFVIRFEKQLNFTAI